MYIQSQQQPTAVAEQQPAVEGVADSSDGGVI